MNDKEKKAIENTKSLLKYSAEHEYFSPFLEHEIDDFIIILNLIQKQEKEIKDLKFKNEVYKKKAKIDKKVIDEILKSWKQDDIRSVEEIKQYFIRKVEDELFKKE